MLHLNEIFPGEALRKANGGWWIHLRAARARLSSPDQENHQIDEEELNRPLLMPNTTEIFARLLSDRCMKGKKERKKNRIPNSGYVRSWKTEVWNYFFFFFFCFSFLLSLWWTGWLEEAADWIVVDAFVHPTYLNWKEFSKSTAKLISTFDLFHPFIKE